MTTATHASFETRAQDLISQMTLEEKISQLMHNAPSIERLGIPAYNWWNECLHGVARAGIATVFPQAIGLAATWNVPLIQRTASVIADEARAKHHEALRQDNHAQYTGLTMWSPNINIFRDPRWGRGQETYGEDPFLTARLGVAFVQGLQGDDPAYLKVVATAKHFAVHSGPEDVRAQFDVHPSARDLWETYLPAFEALVTEAHVASVMGAYNRLYGEPACASQLLMQTILRDQWGFEGYYVSDCGAIYNIYMFHKTVATATEAAALAVNVGCDLECGNTYVALQEALTQGLVDEATLDRALVRAFTARFRLGMFDDPHTVPYAQIPYEVNDAPAHRALALQVAQESLVLLKNADNFLPLADVPRRIAVIGANAHNRDVLLGNYNGTPSASVTPYEGIKNRATHCDVQYASGCGLFSHDQTQFDQAITLAQQSDVIIFVGGLSQALEGEEGQVEGLPEGLMTKGDRTTLDLPDAQEDLLRALHALGKPIVLVLLNGSAVAINWAQHHVNTILEAWYPGEEGGTAIASAVFGDYNPGGKLPITFYQSVADLPPFEDYAMHGRTYRYFTGEPLYPFGYGLSYTRFEYRHLGLSAMSLGVDEHLTIQVDVSNVGERAGDEVVQVYVRAENDGYPLRQLVAFQRVHIAHHSTQTVLLRVSANQFMRVDDDGTRHLARGRFHVSVGGGQEGALHAVITI
jgi:beta-glucosidase